MVDGESVDLQIWDFGGEDRFRFLLPAYALGAQGGIFMYDITSILSLSHMNDWLEVLREQARDIPVIIAGTKADLAANRKVYPEEVTDMGRKHGLTEMLEVSSKTGQNVDLLFESVARAMILKIIDKTENPTEKVMLSVSNTAQNDRSKTKRNK
jgi:small GTP-binding protein